MKIRFILSFFIVVLVLQPVTGRAFVPQTAHLLHLVVQKVKQPSGIETSQIKTIVNCDVVDEQEEIWLDERLMYVFPNQLRAETTTPTGTDFSIESDFEFIKVMNGQTVSTSKSPIDLYTDILLYRNHETLLGQLALSGIDVTRVSFQRYEDTICYVIGQPKEKGQPFAGLWIEKDTFFPLKYVVEKDDFLVECVYSNWQKISRTWYPLEVSIYLDDQLFATVTVSDIGLKAGFAPSLFDIDRVMRLYPEKQDPEVVNEKSGEMDELEKRIQEFKKLYE